MKAHRFSTLIRNATGFSHRRLSLAPFSLSSAASPTPPKFFADDGEGGREIYRNTLKFQRPTTIEWREQLVNSVSFIGRVNRPLKIIDTRNGSFGVHTVLSVRAFPQSNRTFMVQLMMWDEIAKISFAHLRPNDLIYVSGHLGTYEKTHEDGKLMTYSKVTVKQLNYVDQSGRCPTSPKDEESQSRAGRAGLEENGDRLHLWQIFFSNPREWWDNRKAKVNPRQPDFKHKDTGEALWLNPNDPPWIKSQLQLLDKRIAEHGQGDRMGSPSRVSRWVYDD